MNSVYICQNLSNVPVAAGNKASVGGKERRRAVLILNFLTHTRHDHKNCSMIKGCQRLLVAHDNLLISAIV